MTMFLELIGITFQIIKALLVAGLVLWGIPSIFLYLNEEMRPQTVLKTKPAKGHHWRAPGVIDDRMQQRVVEFRNNRNKHYIGRRRAPRTPWVESAAAA